MDHFVPPAEIPDSDPPIIPPSLKSSKFKAFAPAVLTLALLVGGLALTSRQVLNRQTLATQAASPGLADLSLTTTSPSPRPGDTISVNLLINANATQLSAASVVASYPTSKLQLLSITPGSYFSQGFTSGVHEMLSRTDMATAGQAKITLGVPCPITIPSPLPANPCLTKTGSGTVATYSYKVLPGATGTVSLGFTTPPVLTAVGQTGSVLGQALPLNLTISTSSPTSSFTGQYFNNRTLTGTPVTGTPVLTRSDATINFNWGGGAPATGLPADNFSVRWTKTENFTQAGTYRFTTTTDDGVRLKIDGVTIIDRWFNQSPTSYSANRTLTAGNHTIVMEYFENGGGAVAKLTWVKL